MALQLFVDSLESVPESVRSMYSEDGGKFKLQVDGIEDTKGLKSTLEKYKVEAKSNAEKLHEFEKSYQGIDPIKTREMLARFENDAEAKLIAEGKMSEVINARTERLRADYDKKLSEEQAKAVAAIERAKAFQGRVLDDEIRAAAAKAGIHAQAVDDALFRGRSMFTLGEDGKAVQLGQDGNPVLGKDGKSLFTPAEWLESMKEAAPHWFPNGSSGGGATGNSSNQSNSKTINRTRFDALSPAEKSATVKAGVVVVD